MLLKGLLVLPIIYVNMTRCQITGVGPINFIYHKFLNCAKKPTPMDIALTPRWLNNSYQVIDGHFFTPVDVGDNFLAKLSAEMLVHGKSVHLADGADMFCRALRSYLGPLRGDILGSVGLPPDTCPIRQGTYRAKDVHLDFKKSRIPGLPYGIFNITVTLHQKLNNVLNLCLSIELENKPS